MALDLVAARSAPPELRPVWRWPGIPPPKRGSAPR